MAPKLLRSVPLAGERKNYNYFEIYGSKGSIVFNLERMNELQLFLQDDPAYAQASTILVTEGSEHPYVGAGGLGPHHRLRARVHTPSRISWMRLPATAKSRPTSTMASKKSRSDGGRQSARQDRKSG